MTSTAIQKASSFPNIPAHRCRTLRLEQVLTNALLFAHTTPQRRNLVLVTPGNPGVAEFYYAFAAKLFALSDGCDDVLVVSHGGHCGRNMHGRHLSLQEQIVQKEALLRPLLSSAAVAEECDDVLDALRLAVDDAALVLLGHSIGSYINLKALARLRAQRCAAVLGDETRIVVANLFPTFRDLYDGLVTPVKIAILPGVRQFIAALLHYAPSSLGRFLLAATHSMSDEAKYGTADKICYDFVNNLLYMAYCEAQEVLDVDDDINQLFVDSKQIPQYFLYGRTDKYTPLHFVDDLKQDHPHLIDNIHLANPGVKHAFVLGDSESVAIQLQSIIPQFSNKNQ